MNENTEVLFIINKYSGAGYQSGVEGRILARCAELGIEPTLEFTQSRGHASVLAREAATSQKFKVVFAVGGDGTVNEVAQGIIHTNQVMGILPNGSGNGLARHLAIPLTTKDYLQYINSTSVIAMDSFTVNGKLSVNVSGIGFDGHIAKLFNRKKTRGLFGYSQLVIREFLTYHESMVRLQIDHKSFNQKSFIIAIANSSQFGNNARIAPHASVCDGLLDISLIRKVSVYQIPGFVLNMFAGRLHQSAFVEMKKGKNISIEFSEPMAYHVDGEGMDPVKNFTIEMLPASINMLIPEKIRNPV